jgi:hypothetical protein
MNRSQADSIVHKTGALALLYYPEVQVDDPEFKLSADVDWCLEEADELTGADRDLVRDAVARTIVDPTMNREALTELVYGLVPSE